MKGSLKLLPPFLLLFAVLCFPVILMGIGIGHLIRTTFGPVCGT